MSLPPAVPLCFTMESCIAQLTRFLEEGEARHPWGALIQPFLTSYNIFDKISFLFAHIYHASRTEKRDLQLETLTDTFLSLMTDVIKKHGLPPDDSGDLTPHQEVDPSDENALICLCEEICFGFPAADVEDMESLKLFFRSNKVKAIVQKVIEKRYDATTFLWHIGFEYLSFFKHIPLRRSVYNTGLLWCIVWTLEMFPMQLTLKDVLDLFEEMFRKDVRPSAWLKEEMKVFFHEVSTFKLHANFDGYFYETTEPSLFLEFILERLDADVADIVPSTFRYVMDMEMREFTDSVFLHRIYYQKERIAKLLKEPQLSLWNELIAEHEKRMCTESVMEIECLYYPERLLHYVDLEKPQPFPFDPKVCLFSHSSILLRFFSALKKLYYTAQARGDTRTFNDTFVEEMTTHFLELFRRCIQSEFDYFSTLPLPCSYWFGPHLRMVIHKEALLWTGFYHCMKAMGKGDTFVKVLKNIFEDENETSDNVCSAHLVMMLLSLDAPKHLPPLVHASLNRSSRFFDGKSLWYHATKVAILYDEKKLPTDPEELTDLFYEARRALHLLMAIYRDVSMDKEHVLALMFEDIKDLTPDKMNLPTFAIPYRFYRSVMYQPEDIFPEERGFFKDVSKDWRKCLIEIEFAKPIMKMLLK